MILLCLPAVQQVLPVVKSKPLAGAIEKFPDVVFKISSWWNGDYQKAKEKYLNQNFGFHDDLIRLNNQLAFSLWNEVHANGVVIGKSMYLYEENYIKAYYGTDFTGENEIEKKIDKLKAVQDTLKKKNISLILIFAPGKGSFFPEFIPETYTTKQTLTNYDFYISRCQKSGIAFLDFHKWFLSMKSSSTYPLYPQYGIHWSTYGCFLAVDSLVKYIEKERQINLPEFSCSSINVTGKLQGDDYDIGKGMNLIFQLPTYKMAYPDIVYGDTTAKTKPNVLAVADSYYWQVFNSGIPRNIFNNSKFWFYNNEIYPDHFTGEKKVSQLNLKEEIEKQDVILLLSTDANLPKLGWGFIEDTYKIYFGETIGNGDAK